MKLSSPCELTPGDLVIINYTTPSLYDVCIYMGFTPAVSTLTSSFWQDDYYSFLRLVRVGTRSSSACAPPGVRFDMTEDIIRLILDCSSICILSSMRDAL